MQTDPQRVPTKSTATIRAYEAIAGALVWFALILQFYLTTKLAIDKGLGLWVGTARYFGFFTILTNILVALTFTVPLILPRSRWGQFFAQPGVRTAIAVYITVVGIAYSLLLRHIWDPEGWQLVADRILHDVTPILYVVFWFLFVPKSIVQWRNLPAWLIYPLVYVIVALVRGAIFNWYPYPFLEVSKLGYPQVFLNVAMLFIGFCVVAAIFIGVARLTQRDRQTREIRS